MVNKFATLKTTSSLKNSEVLFLEFISNESIRKILLFGDVQSGKTRWIISIIENIVEKKLFDNIIILTGGINDLYIQNKKRIDIIKLNVIKCGYGWHNGTNNVHNLRIKKKNVIFIKTSPKDILTIFKTIKIFSEKTIFIIDESDYGSFQEKNNDTKIFSNLSNIYCRYKKTKFLFVSATPYRNILLSENNKLIPDIIIPKENNYGYYGLDIFHNSNNSSIRKFNSRVPQDTIIIEATKYFIKKLLFKECEEKKYSLLINISNFNIKNCKQEKLVKNVIDNYIKNNQFSDDWKNVYEEILINLKNNIIVFNGKNEPGSINDINNIIIGGIKLSRGITFKNLICEVMLNYSSNARVSTILQRARWFGYREENYESIKVFLYDGASKFYTMISEFNVYCRRLIVEKYKYKFNEELKKEIDLKYKQLCWKYRVLRKGKGKIIE